MTEIWKNPKNPKIKKTDIHTWHAHSHDGI